MDIIRPWVWLTLIEIEIPLKKHINIKLKEQSVEFFLFSSFQFDILHVIVLFFQLPATLYLYIRKAFLCLLKGTQTKALKIQFTIITESVCFACFFTYRFKKICARNRMENKYKEQYISIVYVQTFMIHIIQVEVKSLYCNQMQC